MFRMGMTEGVPIESKMLSGRIENAQKTVEAQNFDARKHLLEYDDVMNKQRETIYAIRRSALEGKDQRDYVLGIAEDVVRELVETFCPREQHPGQWNTTQFLAETNAQFGIDMKAAGADPGTLAHDLLGPLPGPDVMGIPGNGRPVSADVVEHAVVAVLFLQLGMDHAVDRGRVDEDLRGHGSLSALVSAPAEGVLTSRAGDPYSPGMGRGRDRDRSSRTGNRR